MAENIVLSVQLNGADTALAQLTQLDSVVSRIKANRNVKVSVNAKSLSTAAGNAEKLNTNLSQVTQTAQKVGTTGARNVEQAGKAVQSASKNAESFNNGLGNVVLTMAKFRMASSAINLVANGFKEAFAEMKRVDSEMVTIRKVTGYSADEMERLSKNAYSLASKYGRSASEVMSGESVFARAGYTEQIEQLSEMSLLLQNVGDLSAEESARFLIATDAAYKYGGSQEKLMAVIDGLNEITNKHATDMQKMTEGMTVAGSVFAESGESIETFAALLGTATANTQRSGSEMGRGLRTIIMNLRQIRGETEDGELIDGESIAAASKALKDFANISTMENGQIRKASDVLDELAGKWSMLTETQKAAISEGIAGKRQANVLMSLMADWGTYQQMLSDYASGAGSAMQENEIYLDSWAAKTEQVKASWTELISTMTDTEQVKAALDGVIVMLQEITEFAKNTGLDWTTLFGVSSGVFNLNGSGSAIAAKAAAQGQASELSGSVRSAIESFESDFNAEAFTESIRGAVEQGQAFYDTLQKIKQGGKEWTSQEKAFAGAFEALQLGLEEGQSAFDLYGLAVAASLLAAGKSADESAETANSAVSDLQEKLDNLPDEKTITITVAGNGFGIGGRYGSLFPGFASGTSNAPGGPALVNENGPEMIAANGLAYIAGGGRPTVTMLPKGATVLTAQETRRATGGRNLSEIPAYAAGTGSTWRTGGGYSGSSGSFGTLDGSIWSTGDGYSGRRGSFGEAAAATAMTDEQFWAANQELAEQYRKAREEGRKKTDEYLSTLNQAWSGAGVDSGPTPPDFKALEDELSKRLKNLDAQAELAENQEDFLKAMQIYGDAQKYISELLDLYRENGYAEDSDEVLKLANLGYDYASKQLGGYDDLQKRLIDALNALTDATEDANVLAERQEAVDKAREALANAERQRTVRIFNPVTGQWEWVANAGDVEKAREALRSAEQSLEKEQLDQTISTIKNAKPEDLAGLTLSPAILDKLFNGTPEQQTAFLNALNAATGGADYLGSTAAQTAFNQGTNIGTQYNLNGIELTQEMAAGMSIKQLLDMLRGLQLM